MDGIVRVPQSLGYESRHNHLGDTSSRLLLDDIEISRTTKGDEMRIPKTREQIVGDIVYAAGYLLALATLVKFAWWIWQQPW